MTNEEVIRFALVLKECERIRAKIAEEERAFSHGGGGGIPIAAAVPAGEEAPVPAVVDAA
jgi:hypothetical protein